MDIAENAGERTVVILMVCCFLSGMMRNIWDWNFFMHLGSDFSFIFVGELAHLPGLLCVGSMRIWEPNYT